MKFTGHQACPPLAYYALRFHTVIPTHFVFSCSPFIGKNPPYPCRMGCRCRVTWALWLLPLDCASSSFTVSRRPGDTVTSAPAIAPPTQSCTHRGPRMHVNSQTTGTHMHRLWLMHTHESIEKQPPLMARFPPTHWAKQVKPAQHLNRTMLCRRASLRTLLMHKGTESKDL